MEIIYKETLPEKEEYFELFETTGWNEEYQFNKEQLYEATNRSWYLISAYDNDRLIGFGRIISDGIFHALIIDLIVLPNYQSKGIGSNILKKLVDRCKANKIRDIQLFCAKGQTGFYEKHGFVKRPDNAPGMQMAEGVNSPVLS